MENGFEIGDIVETNVSAIGEPRLKTVTDGTNYPEPTNGYWFEAGEQGRVTLVQDEKDDPPWQLVYVTFDDGTQDNMISSWLDLVRRPEKVQESSQ